MDETRAVVVDGWGPVADEVAGGLRRLGRPVRAGGHAADAAELDLATGGPVPGALVLVTSSSPPWWAVSPSVLAPWHVARVPVLPVSASGARVVVGPLVLPGVGACLGCVGEVAAACGLPTDPRGADAAAVVLGGAVAVVTVLAALRGEPGLAGISTEIGDAGTTVVHRVWTSRPGCRCASVRMAG